VKRLVPNELVLSFVPDVEQRLWRTITRRRCQLLRNRSRLHNRLESLLEETHIKLSSFVTDLLGVSPSSSPAPVIHSIFCSAVEQVYLLAIADSQKSM
jgi:hypothetical protein